MPVSLLPPRDEVVVGGALRAAEVEAMVARVGGARLPSAGERRESREQLRSKEQLSAKEQLSPWDEPDEAELVDLIAALERLKAAACAAQAVATVAFDRATRAREAAGGIPSQRRGRGVAAQVALARRESPSLGARHLGLAHTLVADLPHTLAALAQGQASEWAATQVWQATATLSRTDRALVDSQVGPRLHTLSARQAGAAARAAAYRLEPRAIVEQAALAAAERRVWVRPAPDCMAYVTALLPVAQGVAVFAALTRAADSARADGDSRSRGQVMADALVSRVTGQTQADDVPVMVNLVMTDTALLGGSDDVARVAGYGPVPSGVARLVTTTGRAWVRRLYTHPSTGELVAMESRARRFPPALAELVRLRDQQCRVPYCDAPIRHIDHVTPVRSGGHTTYRNAQGLCERHNQIKEEPGFRASLAGRDVELETPTGHRYRSHPPPPLGLGSDLELSPVEARVRRLLHTG